MVNAGVFNLSAGSFRSHDVDKIVAEGVRLAK